MALRHLPYCSDITMAEPASPVNFVCFVDAAASRSTSKAACGGVLRDSRLGWVRGFAGRIGRCSVIKAELKALEFGIKLVIQLQLSNVKILTDSIVALNLLTGKEQDLLLEDLVRNIWLDSKRCPGLVFDYVNRKENQEADQLAKRGLSYQNLSMHYLIDDPHATNSTSTNTYLNIDRLASSYLGRAEGVNSPDMHARGADVSWRAEASSLQSRSDRPPDFPEDPIASSSTDNCRDSQDFALFANANEIIFGGGVGLHIRSSLAVTPRSSPREDTNASQTVSFSYISSSFQYSPNIPDVFTYDPP